MSAEFDDDQAAAAALHEDIERRYLARIAELEGQTIKLAAYLDQVRAERDQLRRGLAEARAAAD